MGVDTKKTKNAKWGTRDVGYMYVYIIFVCQMVLPCLWGLGFLAYF